jgi:tetratricopeptide (TPR) repeat protein
MGRTIFLLGVMLLLGAGAALAQEQPAASGAQQGPPPVTALDVLNRAQSALNARDYPRAVQDYSLFLLLNPTFGQAYYFRGVSYLQMSRFDEALADLSAALRYPAPNAEYVGRIYNLRAILHTQRDDSAAALADLEAGIAAAPELPDLYLTRARVYEGLERLPDALADYTRALELDDTDAIAYSGRALLNLRLDNQAAALADFDRLVALNPNDIETRYRRASLRIAAGDFPAALDDLNAALRLSPDDPLLHLSRAVVSSQLNDPTGAAADYLVWLEGVTTRLIDQRQPLTPGESVVLQLQGQTAYRMVFAAEAGQTVRITASARPGSGADPLLLLLDAGGRPLVGDDDSGGGFDARIAAFTISASGTYTVLVGHAAGNPNGAVRVLLELVQP